MINKEYAELVESHNHINSKKNKTPDDIAQIRINEKKLLGFEKKLSADDIIQSIRFAFKDYKPHV